MPRQLYLLIMFLVPFGGYAQVANYEIGDVVDDFTVVDTNGDIHSLYNITSQGYYVYIDFFFDTCPPCQITQTTFNEFFDTYGCNEGELYMLTINNGSDTNAEVIAYEEEYGGPFSHAPAVGSEGGCLAVDLNFGIQGYPSYVLISPSNEFLYRIDELPIAVSDFEDTFPPGFNPQPISCTPLSVPEKEVSLHFQVIPNPSISSEITIFLDQFVPNIKLNMYSMQGLLLYSETITELVHVIETNLAAGMYFVEIDSGVKSNIQALVIK